MDNYGELWITMDNYGLWYIELLTMVYKPTNITGAQPCMGTFAI